MKKVFIPLALIMIVILLVTGCGNTSSTTTTASTTIKPPPTTGSTSTSTSTTPTVTIKKGGTLRVLYGLSPSSIPGWPGDTANFQKLWANWTVFEPLARLGADNQPIPWLATSWKWGPANAYIDFTLRQGVKFSDGTVFNADAVVLDWNQLITDKDAATTNWDTVTKVDANTVRLTLKKFTVDFWASVAGWSAFIVSPTVLAQGLPYTIEHPTGTGPFLYKSFEKDVSLKFVKNPDYWQAGKPYLDGIDMITVKEILTAKAKMEAGEGDMYVLQQGETLKYLADKGFNIDAQYGGTNFLIFDTANEGSVTNDPNIRMAIEYSINKQEMVDAMGYGYYVVNNQLAPPGNPAFVKTLPSRDYNPAKAKELLKAAGYETGLKLHFINDVNGSDAATYLKSYLEAVGITVELELIDNAKYWDYAMNGWTGILNAGYAINPILPSVLRGYFPPIGVINKSCAIPQAILDKCAAAMVETDTAKYQAMSDEIVKDLYDICFFVCIDSNAMGDALATYVKGANRNSYIDFSVWDTAETWLDK
jgi:peptide/nickel transport system substrate-binding protein